MSTLATPCVFKSLCLMSVLAMSRMSSSVRAVSPLGDMAMTTTGAVAPVILIICGSLISLGSLARILESALVTSLTAVSIFLEYSNSARITVTSSMVLE